MTAVASPSTTQTSLTRNGWSNGNGQISLNSMTPDEVSRMFIPRKSVQRSNSSSSLSSNSSTGTITSPAGTPNGLATPDSNNSRKKPSRGFWPSSKAEPVAGLSTAKSQSISVGAPGPSAASAISALHNPSHGPQPHSANSQAQLNGLGRPQPQTDSVPMLCLSPMNGTFERKTIEVPVHPDVLKIGRQTNAKTLPTPVNGFFDSKVLSRQHAEIWAERDGKIWIRDVRSSNGTFVNGKRLSLENRDSEPHALKEQDVLELGIDIVSEDGKTIVHHKVAARVEHAGIYGLGNNGLDIGAPHLSGDITSNMQWSGSWRNRQNSQGSAASARSINSYTSGAPAAAHAKWLQPVTMEQIVKKLNTELKQARLQSHDLRHTSDFVDAFFNQPSTSQSQQKPFSPTKDLKSRFSVEPPAPPPSQPLPEKPDAPVIRSKAPDLPGMQPFLRRSDTEKQPLTASLLNNISSKSDTNMQITGLVEALSTAHRELASQTQKLKAMEETLRLEREARSTAEQRVAEKSPSDSMSQIDASHDLVRASTDDMQISQDAAGGGFQERLDRMHAEMKNMRQQVEIYRHRAEAAEKESDRDRQTLAEMVASIRKRDEAAKKRREVRVARRQAAKNEGRLVPSRSEVAAENESDEDLEEIIDEEMNSKINGRLDAGAPFNEERNLTPNTLARPLGSTTFADTIKDFTKMELDELSEALEVTRVGLQTSGNSARVITVRDRTQEQLLQASPYASLIGVVLLGVGMMAYLNGWQRVADR